MTDNGHEPYPEDELTQYPTRPVHIGDALNKIYRDATELSEIKKMASEQTEPGAAAEPGPSEELDSINPQDDIVLKELLARRDALYETIGKTGGIYAQDAPQTVQREFEELNDEIVSRCNFLGIDPL